MVYFTLVCLALHDRASARPNFLASDGIEPNKWMNELKKEEKDMNPPTLHSLASARQHKEKPGRPFDGKPVGGGSGAVESRPTRTWRVWFIARSFQTHRYALRH